MQAQRLEREPRLPPELEPLDRTADGQNLAALSNVAAAGTVAGDTAGGGVSHPPAVSKAAAPNMSAAPGHAAVSGSALARAVTRTSKILFLAASPVSGGRRALDREAREIDAKIQATAHRDALAFQTRWAVRPDDLLQALNQDRPAVVHFAGHGTGALGIALHDDTGGTILVTAAALQRLFTTLRDDIRLVVFNACYSP
jgi:CHAT domain